MTSGREERRTIMVPGLELDALMLEKIFGFPRKKIWKPYIESNYQYYIPSGKPRRTHEIDARPVPLFSRYLNDAWQIAEKIHSSITNVQDDGGRNDINFLALSVLSRYGATAASFDLNLNDEWWEEADQLPFAARGVSPAHAICLASLKVAGVEVPR